MKLKVLFSIYTALEAAKDSIIAAPVGGSVDAGVVKGVRLWGRDLDIPLQPIVRK